MTFKFWFGVWLTLILGLSVLCAQGCYKGQGPRMTCNPAQYGCIPQLLPGYGGQGGHN